jgi:transcriptional regulator with XRE-family HTH domain
MNELFTLGDTLRMAREHLKMSQNDVAEATRMKVHMIDAIERNDFSRIDVPLYGKGFIKLYAECMGLDPEPLVREYLERHARSVRPSLKSDYPAPRAPAVEPLPAMPSAGLAAKRRRVDWAGLLDEAVHRLREQAALAGLVWRHWRASHRVASGARRARPYRRTHARFVLPAGLGRLAAGVAALGVLVLLIAGLVRFAQRERPPAPATVAAAPAPGPAPLRLAEEPPPAYLKMRLP